MIDHYFDFETTIGTGRGIVLVRMKYDYDSTGIYNEWIESVRTPGRLNITDYLEDSVLEDLAMLGCKLFNDSLTIEEY